MAGTKKLNITGGTIIYDADDEDTVMSHRWHVNDTGYAVCRNRIDGKKQTIRLHRLINRTPAHLVTDHINHNRLDNRRANLRSCTQKENMQNADLGREKYKYPTLPKYITFDKERNKFMAKKPFNKRFNSLEEAKAWLVHA